jgi:ubiquitin carboxyl-terminal hydrolase 48
MIQKQFRGEYAYVTTCLACRKESVTPSHFYELDLALAGNKNLATCLEDFLKVL